MDASFWALVALILFIGVLVYFGVPVMDNKSLDDRADKIRSDLDEARRLREEAQSLLAGDPAQAEGRRSGSRRTRCIGAS